MNKFKASIGILLIFILGALAGSLGTGVYIKHRIGEYVRGGPPPLMHLLMRRMSHQLNLTEEQETEIEKIIEQAHQDITAFRERYHPEFEKIMDKSFALIRAKLDEEQKAKLDALWEDLKKQKGRRGPPGMHPPRHPHKPPEPPFAALKERLDLTDEQAAKVDPLIEESRRKSRDVMQQQREQGFGRGGPTRDALRAIQEDTEQQLEAVLTLKQMETYRHIERERLRRMASEKPGLDPLDRP